VDEIDMKKPKTVIDLLIVADVFIKASEARARLLESHNTTTRNLPSMTLSYRHNQVIFHHKRPLMTLQ
jgi:hypothetical protein